MAAMTSGENRQLIEHIELKSFTSQVAHGAGTYLRFL